MLDGVYSGFGIGETITFHAEESWTDWDIARLNGHVRALIIGFLRRRGHLGQEYRLITDTVDDGAPLLACHAAAVQGRIPFGDRQGEWDERFGTPREARPERQVRKELCADLDGFSLHAAVHGSCPDHANHDSRN